MLNDLETIFIVSVGLLVIVGLIIDGIERRRRRPLKIEAWAKEKGWRFDGDRKDFGFAERYGFDCLQQGEAKRYAFNIIEGEDRGRRIVAFDYHYAYHAKDGEEEEEGSGSSDYFSAVLIEYDLPLKPLKLRREHVLDRVANFFGRNVINFESDQFSRLFHVTADDRKWAYDVIPTRTMKALLKVPELELQMLGRWVIAAKPSRMDVAKFEKVLAVAGTVLDNIPEYVREDLEGRQWSPY